MRKLIYLFVMVMLVNGCSTINNIDNLRNDNRQALLTLRVGMTKEEALKVMKIKTATDSIFVGFMSGGSKTITINNPYRSEILQGKDKTFEVLYYLTDLKRGDNAVTDDELTPLVFDNSKLIGWGQSFLQDNAQKYEIRIR